jgi:hypothetical protein
MTRSGRRPPAGTRRWSADPKAGTTIWKARPNAVAPADSWPRPCRTPTADVDPTGPAAHCS